MKKTQTMINKIWTEYDKDQSGELSKREMKKFITAIFSEAGVKTEFSGDDFTEFFQQVDKTRDGKISKAEMTHYFVKVG